jgi:hypothetical protein
MASVLLSPYGNGTQVFDTNGLPLNGGLVYTYQAGSSTLLTTYTSANGTIANPNPIVLNPDGRFPNEVWLQTGYSYKFVIQTSSAVLIQTLDNLYPALQNAPSVASPIPSGLIAIWSGSTGSIPSGWVLCDGNNSTPDLRNSFILGAGSTYAVGATGGSTDAIVVSHTHTATSTSVVTDPGHYHTSSGNAAPNGGGAGACLANDGPTPSGNQPGHTTLNATTGITVATTTNNATTGVSGAGANMPPYYALAFIMKT